MNETRGRGRPRRRHIDDIPEELLHRRGRMRRGDIRTAVLSVLAEAPGHGYEVIQTLEAKTGGAWRLSPGSVYPTLQLLEDEGLVRSVERDGKRVYEITDAGREEAASRTEAAGGAPWEQTARGGRRFGELREGAVALHMAAKQVAAAGNAEQIEKASAILKEARRQLYQLLAET